MNTNKLFISFAIIALTTFSVNSLILRNHHNSQDHQVEQALNILTHNVAEAAAPAAGKDDTSSAPDSLKEQLKALMFSDPAILASVVKKQPLSEESVAKLKKVFLNNE